MIQKKLVLAISFAMVLSSSISFASPTDLTHKEISTRNYKFTEFTKDREKFLYVGQNMAKYLIEAFDGKLYEAKEVNQAMENGATDFKEAVKNLSPAQDTSNEEFKVTEIE